MRVVLIRGKILISCTITLDHKISDLMTSFIVVQKIHWQLIGEERKVTHIKQHCFWLPLFWFLSYVLLSHLYPAWDGSESLLWMLGSFLGGSEIVERASVNIFDLCFLTSIHSGLKRFTELTLLILKEICRLLIGNISSVPPVWTGGIRDLISVQELLSYWKNWWQMLCVLEHLLINV